MAELNTSMALDSLMNSAAMVRAKQDRSYDADTFIVCYSPTMITTNGLWQGDNPFEYSLPLFFLQAIIVIILTRVLTDVFRRFRQPRFIAEIVGGIILGPSVMGMVPNYIEALFPSRSIAPLEAMASLGLVYFIFLVGLQVDISIYSRAGRKAWAVTAASIAPAIIIEMVAFVLFGAGIRKVETDVDSYLVFLGVTLAITAYPVLARILAELKLLHTDTGKLAMSSAILNDVLAWVFLAVAIALSVPNTAHYAPVAIIFSGILFVVVLYYTIRPLTNWIMSRTKEGEAIDDSFVVATLVLVLVCGVLADALGIHAVFGSFVLGVIIPNGSLATVMIEKLEDFISGFMMPLFFIIIGIKVDLSALKDPSVYGFLIGVISLSAIVRVAVIVLVSMFYAIPTRDGLSLGIVMNTKGLMEIIVLHVARDKKVLYTESYSTMVMMSVVMTGLVTPLALLMQSPVRHLVTYKRRTIEKARPDAELRMVACIHTTRNAPSIISLLEISHPSKRSPIFVYTIHLVELTGRESAMLIVHENNKGSGRRSGGGGGQGNFNRVKAQSDQIIKAFETYEQQASAVSVQPLTVVSAYSTMHEDVCNLAEDKHATLLILPFHKQHTVDGDMEILNTGIRTLNQHVLANAPCSVGILVDRGLGGTGRIAAGHHAAHHIALLFIGGPDDREALAYASRMAEHPAISVTVIRFIDANQPQITTPTVSSQVDARIINVMTDSERELFLDDECLREFRNKTMNDESVMYMEKYVSNGEETVTALRSLDSVHDLYIVGRGEGSKSTLMAGLADWTESPELGAIGDLLASSDFTATVSVLVIQQYKGNVAAVEAPGSPTSPSPSVGNPIQQYLNKANIKERVTGWGP